MHANNNLPASISVPPPFLHLASFFQEPSVQLDILAIVDSNFELDVNPGAITTSQCNPFVSTFASNKKEVAIIVAVVGCKESVEHAISSAPAIVASTNSATEVLRFLGRAGTTGNDAGKVDSPKFFPLARAPAIGADVPNMREVAGANGNVPRLAIHPVSWILCIDGRHDEERDSEYCGVEAVVLHFERWDFILAETLENMRYDTFRLTCGEGY